MHILREYWKGFALILGIIGIVFGFVSTSIWRSNGQLIVLDPENSESQLRELDPFRKSFETAASQINSTFDWPKIALLDSGLDLDLAEKEAVYLDKSWTHKLDMVSSLIPQPFTDDLSHGTGILLQLSAKRNGFGIEGYIPQAAILPIRVGNREEFYSAKVPLERIRRAFEFAKKHGIRLIGMSLSNVTSLWDKNEMQQLLEQYQNDFLILVASGNDGWNLEYGSKCTYVPVCNQADNLIKVGASDYPASNHGPVVDIWASSKVHIWKHYRYEPRAMRVYELKQTRSTSVAVPKVLAVAALMLKANSSLSPKELKTRILSARNLKGEIDPLLGVKMALH